MTSDKNKICRLCLKSCNGNFEIIQDVTKEMLDVLLNMDFDISDGCVNCTKCTEMLQKCFEFKSICVHTEDKLITFIESRSIKIANIKQVYLEDKQNKNFTLFNTVEICRFCMKPSTNYFALNMVVDECFSDMLQKCLPEVMLNITSSPVSCSNCLDRLKSFFTFLKCLQLVEEHIKAYCETDSEIQIDKMDLNNVVQHILKRISKEDVNNETNLSEDQLVEIYFSRLAIVKNCFKDQRKIHIEEKPTQFQCPYCTFSSSHKRNLDKHLKRIHGIRLLSIHHIYKSQFEDCLKKYQMIHGENAKYECPYCQKVFCSKIYIDNHFLRKHDNLSTLVTSEIYCCNTCCYKTTIKKLLLGHINKHSQLVEYKCQHCSRTFTWQKNLRQHVLSVHLNLRPHTCKGCKKTFKRKRDLHSHIILHHQKDLHLMENVTSKIHCCDHCTFKCIYKKAMVAHEKTHEHKTCNTDLLQNEMFVTNQLSNSS